MPLWYVPVHDGMIPSRYKETEKNINVTVVSLKEGYNQWGGEVDVNMDGEAAGDE